MSNILTTEERLWIEQVAALGPSILFEHGMDEAQAKAFMERPEVLGYLERLAAEVQHQETLGALTRFSAKRQLSRLVPESVRILRDALAGPSYSFRTVYDSQLGEHRVQVERDLGGKPVIRIPEPTNNQLRAATEVLDRVGVTGQAKLGERVTPSAVTDLVHREEVVDSTFAINPDAESYEQQTLSRERIRNVLELLKKRLPDIIDQKNTKKLLTVVIKKSKSAVIKKPKKAAKGKVKSAKEGRPKQKPA